MKKIIGIVVIITMVLGLSGCGNSTSSTDNSKDTLRVGIDLKYPPFMYEDEDGNAAGLEPDLARAFGEYLGRNVEIVNTDFSMLIPALDSGDIDIIISDLSYSKEREQKVDFSDGYRYGATTALVNKDFYEKNKISDQMPVEDFFALDGLKAIGLSGTVGIIVPEEYGVEATEASEIASAIMEITSGISNVLVGSYVVYGDHAANADTTELYLNIPEYSTSCFEVKKGNDTLLDQANDFIKTLYGEDGLYSQWADKYDPIVSKIYFDDSYGLKSITTKPTYNE